TGSLPRSPRATITAVVVATTIRLKFARCASPSSTISCAKSRPPSGALNVVAMPAPAPQAISTLRSSAARRPRRATAAPIEPPICAIGPSRPTAAPAPEEPGGASDRLPEDDVAHRPEDARHDREPDEPDVAAVALDGVPQAEHGLHDAAARWAAAR